MDLSKLPSKLSEKIFHCLTFAEVSQLRGLSKNIHSVARQILNAAFLNLGPLLATGYTAHLIPSKNKDLEYLAFRGRLLKFLSSEHSILLAYCRHYITHDVKCFSAGEILDLFYKLSRNDSTVESTEEENNDVAKLILLIDQYLNWFERYRMLCEKQCPWFGACVVDILDSYNSSKYHLSASQNGSLVVKLNMNKRFLSRHIETTIVYLSFSLIQIKLAGQYIIYGYVEAPPEIGDPLGCEISQYELLQVLRYLRKHVRWHNFVIFQEKWENDSHDKQEKIYSKRTSTGYDVFYKKKSNSGMENRDNVISIRAVISLQCHRSLAPARLCGRLDDRTRFISVDEKRDSAESLNEEAKNLRQVVESSCNPLRLISQGNIQSGDQRRRDEVYNFALEIRSIYPKKWTGSNHGEKFGETTLNINHNFDNIFAAKSEFRLF